MACDSYLTLPTFPCGCFGMVCPKIITISVNLGFQNFFVKEDYNPTYGADVLTYFRTITNGGTSLTTNRYTRAQSGDWPSAPIAYSNLITFADIISDAQALMSSLNFDGLPLPGDLTNHDSYWPKFNSAGEPSGYNGPYNSVVNFWRNWPDLDQEIPVNCPAACYVRTNFPLNDSMVKISKMRVFSTKKLCVRTMVQNNEEVTIDSCTLDDFDISCEEVTPDPEIGYLDFEAPPITSAVNELFTEAIPSYPPAVTVGNFVSVFQDCNCEDLLP
jgi:hypothetical protein